MYHQRSEIIDLYLLAQKNTTEIQEAAQYYQQLTGKNLFNVQDDEGKTLAHLIVERCNRIEMNGKQFYESDLKAFYYSSEDIEEETRKQKNEGRAKYISEISKEYHKKITNTLQPYLDLLFTNNADFSITDKNGNTPVHCALNE
jgi:ankyrin repeat protein